MINSFDLSLSCTVVKRDTGRE